MRRIGICAIAILIIACFTLPSYAFFNSDVKKAKKFMSAQMYTQAIELLTKRINDKPTDAEAHFLLGTCYLKNNDLRNAEDRFKSAAGLNSKYRNDIGEIYFTQGKEFLNSGNLRKGETFFQKASHFNPSINNRIGTEYFRQGNRMIEANRFDLADNFFQYCVRYDVHQKENISKVYMEKGDASDNDSCLILYKYASKYGEGNSLKTIEAGNRFLSVVWVLDNNDKDFKNPPFNDTVYIIGSAGNILNKISTFNTSQSIGGKKALSVSPDGSFALISEEVGKKLSKYTVAGKKEWSKNYPISSLSISQNNKAYCLTSAGTIYGKNILVLDTSTGDVLREEEIEGFDIAVDEANQVIWIVGDSIKKYDLELKPILNIDPIPWCALSVDYTSDGSIWVADGFHPQVEGCQKRIFKISSDGKILKTINLKEKVFCVSVDRNDDRVWVAGKKHILCFNSSGQLIQKIPSRVAWSLKVNQKDRTVLVASHDNKIYKYSRDGRQIKVISGFSNDQKWVSIPKL